MSTTDDRTAVLAALAVAKEQQDQARAKRINLMRKARGLDIPNTRIAAAMGITEGAVRMTLKRAEARGGELEDGGRE